MTATVLAVCAAQRDVILDGIGASGIDKRPIAGPVEVTDTGLVPDHVCDTKHHGGVDQALYVYDDAQARRWAEELGRDLPYGWFGENLRIAGMPISDALVGECWRIGADVVTECTIPRVPCRTFGAWAQEPRWVKRFMQRADYGAYLRVRSTGTIAAGDHLQVVSRPDHGVRVRDLLTGDVTDDRLRALLGGDDLPAKVIREATRLLRRAETAANRDFSAPTPRRSASQSGAR